MRGRLGLLTAVAVATLLGAAAYERTDGDPTSAARRGLSGSAVPEFRQPSANAAESRRTAGAEPQVTPQSVFVGPPCYPTIVLVPYALLPWLSDQFVQWSPDGDQILFTQRANLYAVSEDGARRTQVATGSVDIPDDWRGVIGGMMAFDISPDGKQVAYSTCEYPKRDIEQAIRQSGRSGAVRLHSYQIATASIDGRQPQLLTNYRRFDNSPSWSPDGERIAFLAGGDPLEWPNRVALMTMAADGTDQRVIVEQFDSLAMRPPAWSPDGTHLAFAGDDGESGFSIYTVRADGGDLRRLTDTLSGPVWSPDGSRIAFAKADGREVAIYTIAGDGTDERRIAPIPDVVWDPATRPAAYIRTLVWSPDGSKILFTENRELAGHNCSRSPTTDGVYVVGADGSGLVGLGISDPKVYSYVAAAWSPNGTRIAVLADGAPALAYFGGNSCDYTEAVIEGDARPLILFTMAVDGADVEVLAQADEDGTMTGTWTKYQEVPADVAGNVAACSEGTVVVEPEANPGLVRDCEALMGLRDVLLLGPATNSWSATPIDRWKWITVEGSPARVTGLTLRGLGITGTISSQLGELTELRVLDLSNNSLGGAIPAEFGSLTKLERLDLSRNYLSGRIPAALGQMAQLRWLDLSSNYSLAGWIPWQLGQLAELRVLNLSSTDLTARIPPELGALAELEILNLSKLESQPLTGSDVNWGIPAELGGLAKLQVLDLSWTVLGGDIPPELGALAELETLNLRRSLVTGEIPSELGGLAKLRELDLSLNDLRGDIPSELGALAELETLGLSGNVLTGQIPAELGQLKALRTLGLSHNDLTGEIPAELGQLTSLTKLNVSKNRLTGCLPVGLRGIEFNDLAELELPDCAAAVEQQEGDPGSALAPGLSSRPAAEVRQRPAESVSGWWALLTLPLALAVAVIVRVVLRGRTRS